MSGFRVPVGCSKKAPFEQRFMASFRKSDNGCWIWLGAPTTWGYGQILRGDRRVSAHRASWELHVGPVPDGLFVLHRCDVRLCVRPQHLFLGTQADNCADKVSKGRQLSGNQHPQAKLTPAQVSVIRARRASGERLRLVAADYGVTMAQVSAIARGRAWRSEARS